NINLRSLETAKGLTLPQTVGGGIYLYSLTSAKGLKIIRGSVFGDKLKNSKRRVINTSEDFEIFLSNSRFYNAKIVNEKGEEVEQLNQDERGAIIKTPQQSTIILGKNSDVTTPLHEIAHEYERVLTAEEKKTILDWTGHKKW